MMQNTNSDEPDERVITQTCNRSSIIRNLIGFWCLGLTNNFGYVIMLSAAHDLLTPDLNTTEPLNRTGKLIPECNPIGTGAILLADILPSLLVKITAPFYILLIPYWFKVGLTILLGAASFLLVSFGGSLVIWLSITGSRNERVNMNYYGQCKKYGKSQVCEGVYRWMTKLNCVNGVVCASLGAGFGEVVLLGLSSHFDNSGTGAAGLFGSLSYAGLTAVGVSPSNSLLIMLVIPAIMTLTYFVLLVKPDTVYHRHIAQIDGDESHGDTEDTSARPPSPGADEGMGDEVSLLEEDDRQVLINDVSIQYSKPLTWHEKKRAFVWLLQFVVPLMLVYFAEYFINQGLLELVFFKGAFLTDIHSQYRWYCVIYQLGVFISRSSVNVIQIKFLTIFPILQFVNVMIIILQVFFNFIPSIWIMFGIILFEGLLGGGAYCNTFYRIAQEAPEKEKEFCMGVGCVGDSLGISVAAACAIPIHNLFCKL